MAPVLKQLFIARIITIAAPIISIIFALASFSNSPASTMFIAMIIVLAANVFYISLLVLMIWEIVLIYNSYQSMEAYSKQPDQVPPTATEKTTAAVIGGVIQRT